MTWRWIRRAQGTDFSAALPRVHRAVALMTMTTFIVSACGSVATSTGAPMPAAVTDAPATATAAPATPAASYFAPSPAPECPNPHGGACLGPVPAGTYATTVFEPALSFSVPAGWDNEEDLPGNFLLLPPGMKLDGVDAGTSDYIGVYTQVAPDPGCATSSGQPAGAPQAVAACIAGRHDLIATKPRSVKIGGLSGYVLDVRLARGADGTSLMVGLPPSGLEHGLIPRLTIRLYLLAFRSGALAVEIDDVDRVDLAGYSRVVEQFRFGT